MYLENKADDRKEAAGSLLAWLRSVEGLGHTRHRAD